MMHQPVNERGREPIVSKHRIPARKLQIRCHDQALPLIALRDHLKHQLRRVLMKRYKPELINHNQLSFAKTVHEAVQRSLIVPLKQYVRESRGGEESHLMSCFAGVKRDSRGKMCFACSHSSQEDQVFLGLNEVKILHILPGKPNRKLNVVSPDEIIKRLDYVETSCFDQSVYPVDLPFVKLKLQKLSQIFLRVAIELKDTLNKSGFRRKKSWIYGLFLRENNLKSAFP